MIEGLAYSAYDCGGQAFYMHGLSYEEAVIVTEGEEDRIWLAFNMAPFLELVDHFNRIVILDDGEEIRSAVLRRGEIVDLAEIAGTPQRGPLGERAPLLTIDHQTNQVSWECPLPRGGWFTKDWSFEP